MNSMKYFSTLENINNQSCNLVPHDVQCNTVNVELCEDDQLYQPLTSDLYSIPEHFVPVFNTCIDPSPAPCHFVESEKSVPNKLLMKQKFAYPRIDPPSSDIIDKHSDDEKMASILRICAQILIKEELQCWNKLAERYLENATRYESGIPKIHADMLAEIKHYCISGKK